VVAIESNDIYFNARLFTFEASVCRTLNQSCTNTTN
jgi:hypothetical protein